jgi:hypothetical protein
MALIKCAECGNEVSDRAQKCPKCGHPVKRREKRAWLAGLLNFLLPGLGYLYNGRRIFFGILLLLAVILDLTKAFGNDPIFISTQCIGTRTSLIASLILALAFALDGLREAKAINDKTRGECKRILQVPLPGEGEKRSKEVSGGSNE